MVWNLLVYFTIDPCFEANQKKFPGKSKTWLTIEKQYKDVLELFIAFP